MAARILILGGGTGGTVVANRLRKAGRDIEVVVVDSDDAHVYQPGLLFVPFGLADPAELVKPRHAQIRAGATFLVAEVDRVDSASSSVQLGDGRKLEYDVLIVATGATLLPGETEGLPGPHWTESVFTFSEREDIWRRLGLQRVGVHRDEAELVAEALRPAHECRAAVQWDRHEQVERDLALVPADDSPLLDLARREFRLHTDALAAEQPGEVLGGDGLREGAVERGRVDDFHVLANAALVQEPVCEECELEWCDRALDRHLHRVHDQAAGVEAGECVAQRGG